MIQREFAIKNGHDSLRSFKSSKSINAQNPPRHIRYSITDVTMAHVRSDQLFAFFNDHSLVSILSSFDFRLQYFGALDKRRTATLPAQKRIIQIPLYENRRTRIAYRVKNQPEWSARYQTTPGTVRVFIASLWEIMSMFR